LFFCGIEGVGGGDNVGFIDFFDEVGKHTFGCFWDPLLVQFTMFAVLTDDEFDFGSFFKNFVVGIGMSLMTLVGLLGYSGYWKEGFDGFWLTQ
jgi:hypothetical protein